MTRYYCTYFDQRFLSRALALYHSLVRCGGEFKLWALCLDDASYHALRELRLAYVEPIRLADLEADDPGLAAVKASRTLVEYYFTCTPSLPLYVLRRAPEVDLVTYLDADLFFFADPEPLFEELEGASIGIIPHRYSSQARDRERFGRYNVGWISFRRDEAGLACLGWWRERCLEWCYARVEDDRYADQKYLDQWPERFAGVREIGHKGANLGPWNLANYAVTARGGAVWVDEQPLLFYHFSSFLPVASWLYNTNLASWGVRPGAVLRRQVVGAYIQALRDAAQPLAHLQPHESAAPLPVERAPESGLARLRRKLRALLRVGGGLLAQDHLLVLRNRVL
jgi:hypothetical protein